MNILLTGGTGYIGSHTALILADAGHKVVLYDNLSNSEFDVVLNLEKISGKQMIFIKADVRNTALLKDVIEIHNIDAVIHFAGVKAVGESVVKPVDYYANNVHGSISLIEAMQKAFHGKGIKTLLFSSSATVYGDPQYLPIDEVHPTKANNPYGRSKLFIEEMLADVCKSDFTWRISCLRYFNPVGAHESGLIGEKPNGVPNNLMPYILQVATKKLAQLNIFGQDYPTSDGTGIRDYVHVMDLAEGHLAAINHLGNQSSGFNIFNLGTGQGHSVLEMVNIFESITTQSVPINFTQRRQGDIASCYAKVDKAKELLGWKSRRTIENACSSAWKWESLRK